MIAVIQCAGSKQREGGYLSNQTGERVVFVAQPDLAPKADGYEPVHPDGAAPGGRTWREEVLAYNESEDNPQGLYTAWELYRPAAYRRLIEALGVENVLVLSAGWGLVRADFRLPMYDITFTSQVKKDRPWTYRRKSDVYDDFLHLPESTTEPIYYFGGSDYVNLFCRLTQHVQSLRTVYYKSAVPPKAPGCVTEQYPANRNTNWHYDCADWFIGQLRGRGSVQAPSPSYDASGGRSGRE